MFGSFIGGQEVFLDRCLVFWDGYKNHENQNLKIIVLRQVITKIIKIYVLY